MGRVTMRMGVAFEPGGGYHVGTAVAEARELIRQLDLTHAWVIFNEVPLRVTLDNDAEVDEVWRRHMDVRSLAHHNPHPECSICRSRHGSEIIHPCE